MRMKRRYFIQPLNKKMGISSLSKGSMKRSISYGIRKMEKDRNLNQLLNSNTERQWN